jgi:hypothetical protein
MNVQTLVTTMLVGMGNGEHNGKPLKTMKDLYLCFERDINAIVDYLSVRGGPVTQGVVFAELLDAVEDTKVSLREAMENAQAKLAAQDAREAAKAAEKATEAPRRTRGAAAAPQATGRKKKPGVGRRPAAVAAVAPKRRGRPPKNR